MKVLITGGAGFMGSNMVRHLLNTYPEYEILNFDKLTYAGNLTNLKDVEENPRYTFFKGDIASEEDVDKAFTEFKPDVVLNYAAETHVDRSILDPKAFWKTNIVGTIVLLDAVNKHGIKKMVHVSTDEVFGDIDEGLFTEESPFDPNSPYSAAKAGGDLMCGAYFRTYQTPVVVSHSCNFFGPFQFPEKIIPLFITNLIEGKKVPVYGDGQQMREWIYTEDHCSAMDAIMHKGVEGEVYNIGTGDRLVNLDITEKLLNLLGKGEEMIEHVKDRAGHDRRYAVDSTKLRTQLGWEPQYSFDEALQMTVDWYKENDDWWKTIKSGAYEEYYNAQYKQR